MAWAWVHGVVGPLEQAVVSVADRGFTVGDGVFETVLVRSGRPVALTRHVARLERSAALLGLGVPAAEVLRHAVEAVVELGVTSGLDRQPGRLRITVTSGAGMLVDSPSAVGATLVVTLVALPAWPERITVASVPWTRNPTSALAGAKCTSYGESLVALRAAHQRGASEALLGNTAGLVCEGSASNVVLLVDGELITPPLSTGCLPGVTRALLLHWARQQGVAIRETELPMTELGRVTGMLLTSATREVQVVHELDGRVLGISQALESVVEMFHHQIAINVDP